MEGRWAQLATDAHIAGAIDYSRPIKCFAEDAILNRMELIRDLQYSALYPAKAEDGEGEYIRTKTWVDHLKKKLKPWLEQEDRAALAQNSLLAKISYLESQRNK